MKKILNKKKSLRGLSSLLACCLITATIGAYPLVAKAAVTTNMFTTEDSGDWGAQPVTDCPKYVQDDAGVKVTYASEKVNDNEGITDLTLTTTDTYNVTGAGVHLEVSDIIGKTGNAKEYSFVVFMGQNTSTWHSSLNYADDCIAMAFSSNGYYKIWYTNSTANNPQIGWQEEYILSKGQFATGMTDDKLTLDIQAVNGQYNIIANGKQISFVVDADKGLSEEQLKAVVFGFHVYDAIHTDYYSFTNTHTSPWTDPWSAPPYGVSYTIKELLQAVDVVPSVTLSQSALNLEVGEQGTLTASVYPTTGEVTGWSSDNTAVATVVDGVVTGVSAGTATITVTADNGKTATCTVTVYDEMPTGIVQESEVKIENNSDGTGVSLEQVSTGIQVKYDADEYNSYVTSKHQRSLERGILYQITDIKKTDANADKDYSIAISIGNNTNGQQWYDKKGYMILYGKSGNFAILKTKGAGLYITGSDTPNQGSEKIVAEKIDALGDTLSLYVKEENGDWTLIVNDKYSYTLDGAATYLGAPDKYWFSVGAMSDFTATNEQYNPTSGLSWYGVDGTNKKSDVSFTITNIAPTVPTLFSDGMLFQQKKAMNIWGYGIAGQPVTAKLYQGNTLVEEEQATVSNTGRWDVSFGALDGSYDKYQIDITLGSNTGTQVSHSIKDILIGELWISGGQSNMAWRVDFDADKDAIYQEADNEYIRVFLEPTYPLGYAEGKQSLAIDVLDAYWGYGNNPEDLKNASSVAYSFAKNLQEELEMPVGIINTAIGGTYIEAWLSREAVENDASVLEQLKDNPNNVVLTEAQKYYAADAWATANPEGYAMSSFYNQKIGPLEGMNVAGVIWYQGEHNTFSSEIYDIELDLLKRSWGEVFGYENGDMPFIFTQVAPYDHKAPWADVSDTSMFVNGYLSLAMEKGWKLSADKNTAMLTIYDLPVEWDSAVKNGETSPIHPHAKTKVGERFSMSAINMAYGGGKEYTAPVYKSMEVKDNAIYVTFDRVGDGLKTTDGSEYVHGFTIAGQDGIYVNAEAMIIDEDTVKVWNNRVAEPKNVIYAFDDLNQGSNLCNSVGIPASPLRTVQTNDYVLVQDSSITYFSAQDWMYADKDVWVCADAALTPYPDIDYKESFKVEGGTYTYDDAIFAEGTASLKVSYTDDFTVAPILSYDSIKSLDWSKYNYLSVSLRNEENVDVSMVIHSGSDYTVPTVEGKNSVHLSGSDKFTVITFDLTELDDTVLKALTDVTFKVTTDGSGTMHFDKFMFGMTDAVELDETNPDNEGDVSDKDTSDNNTDTGEAPKADESPKADEMPKADETPKTGDDFKTFGWSTLMLVCCIVFGSISVYKKRKTEI